MCICFFYVGGPEDPYQFALAGNRDEFFSRDSAPMHEWWPEAPRVIAGVSHERASFPLLMYQMGNPRTDSKQRDLVRGGTWWGFARGNRPGAFKFSVIHNFRHAGVLTPDAKSRGELPINFLKGDHRASDYAYAVEASGYDFNGFTLIVADEEGTYFVSNRPHQVRHLDRGFYGLSNASLDTPWPKLIEGKETFVQLMKSHFERPLELSDAQLSRVLVDAVLRHTTVHPDDLPDILPKEREIALSSVFIKPYEWDDSGMYGTRTHSIAFVRHDGSAFIAEHNLDVADAQSKAYLARDEKKPQLIPDAERVLTWAKTKSVHASSSEFMRGKWAVREFEVPPFDALARL